MEAFSLFAKLTLDSKGFDDGLNKAKSSLEKVGSGIGKIGGAFGSSVSAIGSGLATVAKAGAAAVATASTAVGALVAKSVASYSDYEQLVGGVQKLYGNMGMSLEDYAKQQGKTSEEVRADWERNEKAAKMMMEQANNAFKTSGMSANQYMETATSFSAALIKSVGGDTVEAAKLTDEAMTAISDNWNTFGGDIGMIQGAFQGFAKQNYTMLDNLKLGYGGTKEEMKALIADAAKATDAQKKLGLTVDATSMSFDNIVKAIQVVQYEQQIYGTTAREASTTIQGSLSMVKSAWENLITGMADKEADLDGLMNNLVDSIAGYTDKTGKHINGLIDNILPVAEKALSSVSTLIEKLGPKIAEGIPKLVNQVLPQLINAGAEIVASFGNALVDNSKKLLETARIIISTLLNKMVKATSEEGDSKLMELIMKIANFFNDHLEYWLDCGVKIIENIINGIMDKAGEFMSVASEIILKLVDAFAELYPYFIDVGLQILETILQGLDENFEELVDAAEKLITGLVEAVESHIDKIMELGASILNKLVTALIEHIPDLMKFGTEVILKLIEYITEHAPEMVQSAIEIITTLVEGLANALPQLIPAAVDMILTIAEALIDNLDQIVDAAIELIVALADGLIKALPKLIEKAPVIIEKLVNALINNLPKLVKAAGEIIGALLKGIIENLPKIVESGMKIINSLQTGIARLLTKLWTSGKEAVDKIREGIKSIDPIQWGKDMIDSFISGIKDRISKVREAAEDIAGTIKSVLGFSEPEEGPLANFHTFAPDMMNLFIKGVKDNTRKLQDQIEKSFDFSDIIVNGSAQITAEPSVTAESKTATPANITMNVYGAEGQDVKELADIVSDRLLHMINQTGAVYA